MKKLRFLKLPPEVLLQIFKLLDIRDLRNLMLTNKYLKKFIINESSLWKFIYRDKLIINRMIKVRYLSWYDRCRLSHNWCKGKSTRRFIIEHNINYMPWVQLLTTQILFLSYGKELSCYSFDHTGYKRQLLWNLTVPTVERFDVRTNDISRFIVKKNLIVCGNRDGSCAIYDFQDRNKKPDLVNYIRNCHNLGQKEVSAVEKWKNCIVTASYVSPCIHFWSMNEGVCSESETTANKNAILKTFEIPECVGCRSLAIDWSETKMAVGLNGNYIPICMDLNTDQYLIHPQRKATSTNVVRDIQWHNDAGIISVTHTGYLQYTDLRTGDVTYKTKDPFESSLYCLKTDGDRAVVAGSSEYARCVLFDLRSPYPVQMYFTQKKFTPIYSLDFDTKKLISAGDRRVAINNFDGHGIKARDYSYNFPFDKK